MTITTQGHLRKNQVSTNSTNTADTIAAAKRTLPLSTTIEERIQLLFHRFKKVRRIVSKL